MSNRYPVPIRLQQQFQDERALRKMVLEMRLDGLTILQIADRLGVTEDLVRELIRIVLGGTEHPDTSTNRQLEEARLDRIIGHLETVLHAPEELGVRIPDRLQAISMLMKVSEQRAKLLGLNADTRVHVTHAQEDADSALRTLLEEARANASKNAPTFDG